MKCVGIGVLGFGVFSQSPTRTAQARGDKYEAPALPNRISLCLFVLIRGYSNIKNALIPHSHDHTTALHFKIVATTLVNQHPRHLRHPRSTSSEEIVLIRVHSWLASVLSA